MIKGALRVKAKEWTYSSFNERDKYSCSINQFDYDVDHDF